MNSLLVLIPLLPLAGFLVNGLFKLPKAAAGAVGCAGPFAAFALSVAAALNVPAQQNLGSWFAVGSFSVSFGFRVDELSAVMILVVTGVGSLIHLYSLGYMHDDEGFSRFFAYLNLFMFSMLVLVLGDSLPLMFLGWEGVGLCSYLLIGFWYKDLKNADAGRKAFVVNRVGDFGFLLGIFVVWQIFGTLDFAAMTPQKAAAAEAGLAATAGLLLFVGAAGKSAQIPLYVWLPDAMAGPTPVSALIHAATMVTAGVYMMGRMHVLYAVAPEALEIVGLVAAATALLAAVIAVAQNDIKKVLAYSTVSQLGFMFVGIAASSPTAGLFHVVTHAFFKALLFLGAGAVIHALHGEQDVRNMGGLARPLRSVFLPFLVGSLALAGCPGTAGFFSKDMILASVIQKQWYGTAAVMVLTAGLTAFYTTRLLCKVFLAKPHHPHHDLHLPGATMTIPLVILGVLSAVGGFALEHHHALEGWLGRVWSPAKIGEHAHHAAVTWSLLAFFGPALLSALLFLVQEGWVKAWLETPFGRGLHRLAENKFWVDEIYEYLVIAPVRMGSTIVWFVVDRLLIDALLVNGAGRLVYAVGGLVRRPHRGPVNVSLVVFLLGALALLGWLAWRSGAAGRLLP
jgi:NADH-quinone oxidoreductase subunit L